MKMQVFREIEGLRIYLEDFRREGKSIGFVPTMGYLHLGHLSLIEASARENDITVLSIYVNPTQFAPSEDLDQYPRDLVNDKIVAKKAGADVIFIPDNHMMYGENHATYINVNGLTKELCGQSRPTHFQGVTTIVNKLFNIVQPKRAYFGQKDAQQAIVIRRMVEDLNIPVQIVTCPIVREVDGLAMSSRNVYLSENERKQAIILHQSLQEARKVILAGERSAQAIISLIEDMIKSKPAATIDYVSVVSGDTVEHIKALAGNILIALAVRIGKTRLIDNLQMEV